MSSSSPVCGVAGHLTGGQAKPTRWSGVATPVEDGAAPLWESEARPAGLAYPFQLLGTPHPTMGRAKSAQL